MQTLILKSDNKEASNAIKTLANVLGIKSSMNENDGNKNFEIIKGVKINQSQKK